MTNVKANGLSSARFDRIRRWLAVGTVMLSMLAATMSSTMVNVAIPRIMAEFQITQDSAQWLSSGFLAATACVMLLNAWLVDRLGIRQVFNLSILLFCVSSIAAQIAPDFLSMAIARIVQGASTGLLQPLALTVIFVFFDRDERVLANGIFGMGVVLGPVLGPIVGGLVIDQIEWRYVFGAPLPIAALSLVLGAWSLPGRAEPVSVSRLSWLSFALLVTSVTSLLLAMSSVRGQLWTPEHVVMLFVLFPVSVIAFVIIELRTNCSIIQPKLFSDKIFSISSIISIIFSAGLFGSIYLIPVAMQEVQGYSASGAGLLMTVSSIVLVFLYPIAGRLFMRVNAAYPIAVGLGLFALSSVAWSGATAQAAFWLLVAWTAVGRIGLGFVTTCLSAGAVITLQKELLPGAAGTLSFIRMLGGAIGVNALAIYVEHATARNAEAGATAANSTPQGDSWTLQWLYNLIGPLTNPADMVSACVAGDSSLLCAKQAAFHSGFLLLTLAFVFAAALALAMARAAPRDQKPTR